MIDTLSTSFFIHFQFHDQHFSMGTFLIFWDEVFMVRDVVKMDNVDVWPLAVENDMLLKYN